MSFRQTKPGCAPRPPGKYMENYNRIHFQSMSSSLGLARGHFFIAVRLMIQSVCCPDCVAQHFMSTFVQTKPLSFCTRRKALEEKSEDFQ